MTNENSEIKISVIIPCYNSSATMIECLSSILLQEVYVEEIVIVDDGSTDNTVSIIQHFINSTNTKVVIKLFEQKNAGPSSARNKGVAEATSNYIAFLDSDDAWFSKHILEIRRILSFERQYKIICTKYLSGTFKKSGEVNFNQTLFRNYFITPCVVVERNIFLEFGGFDLEMKYCEDYMLFLQINHNYPGYIIDYVGAKNIQEKQPFGDKGLSGNLKMMHQGVMKCFNTLFAEKKINGIELFIAKAFATLKYYRRIWYTYSKS